MGIEIWLLVYNIYAWFSVPADKVPHAQPILLGVGIGSAAILAIVFTHAIQKRFGVRA